jgi:hypothetical protein
MKPYEAEQIVQDLGALLRNASAPIEKRREADRALLAIGNIFALRVRGELYEAAIHSGMPADGDPLTWRPPFVTDTGGPIDEAQVLASIQPIPDDDDEAPAAEAAAPDVIQKAMPASPLPPRLAVLNHDALEGVCIDCGLCCFAATMDSPRRLVPELACKHLEWKPRPEDGAMVSRCSVYETRHEVAPWCQTLSKAIERGVLPAACPYVVDLPGYVGAVPPHEHDPQAPLRDLIKATGPGRPEWASEAAWDKALRMTKGEVA